MCVLVHVPFYVLKSKKSMKRDLELKNIYFQTHWTSCDAQGASVQFEYAK